MTVPFVHSRFERVPGDYYPTIDARCIYGLLQHFQPTGLCVDPCAPDGSGIVNTLLECGYTAVCLSDAFLDSFIADWIVTNPPYDRTIVDSIIKRQIARVECGEVQGLAVLLRSNFDFAKSRKCMFEHPLYYGQIKLRFRPWWSEDRTAQPIHNYVWQIWHAWKPNFGKDPVVLYSDGDKPHD